MTDETVLAGIDPHTRNCSVVATNDDAGWAECRSLGLIVVPIKVAVARKLWGTTVPCLDALLPVPDNERRIFAHVVAPELGDCMFCWIAAEALHKIADLNDQTGGDDSVKTGLWVREGRKRAHVAIYWPVHD